VAAHIRSLFPRLPLDFQFPSPGNTARGTTSARKHSADQSLGDSPDQAARGTLKDAKIHGLTPSAAARVGETGGRG
jgi:hypothetical protein